MQVRRTFFLFLIVSSFASFAQNIDSVRRVLKNARQDTTRLTLLNFLIENTPDDEWPGYNEQLYKITDDYLKQKTAQPLRKLYLKYYAISINNRGLIYSDQGNKTEGLVCFNKSLAIQKEINDEKGMATTLTNIGSVYQNSGNNREALGYLLKGLAIREKLGDPRDLAETYNNIGVMYLNNGDITTAIDYIHRSLKIQEEIGDKAGLATSLVNIASISRNNGQTEKAIEYYEKGLKLSTELRDRQNIGRALVGIGNIYMEKRDCKRALGYFLQSLEVREKAGDKQGISNSLHSIGLLYQNIDSISKAMEYYQKSLAMQREIGDVASSGQSFYLLASLEYQAKHIDKAIAYAEKGLQIAKQVAYPENLRNASNLLYLLYKIKGRHMDALEMHELFAKMRDSINNQETRKASLKKQYQYDYERKASADSVRNHEKMVRENIKHAQSLKQQRIYMFGGIAGFLFMLIIAGISLRAFRNKQKANLIIREQKKLAEHQKFLIEEKQKEIISSITYAQRIQKALIISEQNFARQLQRLQKK